MGKCVNCHLYQGRGFPLCSKKPPLWDSFIANRVWTMVRVLVSTSRGALDPPISVRTQPGWMLTHSTLPSFKSWLSDFVAALSPAFEVL